jgi:hypothetical protein
LGFACSASAIASASCCIATRAGSPMRPGMGGNGRRR